MNEEKKLFDLINITKNIDDNYNDSHRLIGWNIKFQIKKFGKMRFLIINHK